MEKKRERNQGIKKWRKEGKESRNKEMEKRGKGIEE